MKQKNSIHRTLDILELIGGKTQPLGFGDIQKSLSIPKASLSRILNILKERNMIVLNESTKKYQIGTKILYLLGEVLNNLEINKISDPYMEKLSKETRETVELAIPDEDAILYVSKNESPESIRIFAQIGARYQTLHASALGKIMLAFSPPEILDKFIKSKNFKKLTEKTIITSFQLKKEIENIRVKKWAFDNQEVRIGVRRISAPIFNYKNKLCGIIGIAGPSFRIKLNKVNLLGELVKETGEEISKELGYNQTF